MLRSRRESHHSNGITAHDSLQPTSATKLAKLRPKLRRIAILKMYLLKTRSGTTLQHGAGLWPRCEQARVHVMPVDFALRRVGADLRALIPTCFRKRKHAQVSVRVLAVALSAAALA